MKFHKGDYISYSYGGPSSNKPFYARIIRKSNANREYVVINDYGSDTDCHIWIGRIIKKLTEEEFFLEIL
jgi:hypothetical protein